MYLAVGQNCEMSYHISYVTMIPYFAQFCKSILQILEFCQIKFWVCIKMQPARQIILKIC